ncbi:MAG: NAD(P)/FAD-dependent oxidoreductase [Deltaproteobacteria bacterium]|nr:NAD(P)/FAD-dependent oxidoreductase [Deltaproteobacteria bacterium]
MGKCKHLIVGCGPAALAAVQAIRGLRPKDEIKLVSREDCLPYSPAALPYLFNEELKESDFFAKGEDCLRAMDAQLVRGKEATELIPETRQIQYRDGQREEFDKLLIATGSQPWVPVVDGLGKISFYTIRTFKDYKKIQEALQTKQAIVIYGAGLVAVELAEKLTLGGHSVTIIARSSLLRRYFASQITKTLQDELTKQGVKVLLNSTLKWVRKRRGKLVLGLPSGDALTADQLLIATGVDPNRLGSSSLAIVGGGVQTGRHMETPVPDVYAAGDVAAAPAFFGGENGVNPILPEALEQGKVAGYNMAGQKAEYRGWMPWNLLRCFGQYFFNIGLTGTGIEETAEVVERGEGGESFRMIFKDHYLIGVECSNRTFMNPGVFGYLITRRVPVKGYKDLLSNKPMETANWLMRNHRRSQSASFTAHPGGK